MPKKEETPLCLLQKDTEALQKKVNSYDKECSSFLKKNKDDKEKHNEFYTRCQDLKAELDELIERVEELEPEKENLSESKLEGKKKDLGKKHKNIEEKLTKLEPKLEPDEDIVRKHDEEEEDEEGSVEDEEDSGEDEEDEESEEEETTEASEPKQPAADKEEDEDEDDLSGDEETEDEEEKPIVAKSSKSVKSTPATSSKHTKDVTKEKEVSKPALASLAKVSKPGLASVAKALGGSVAKRPADPAEEESTEDDDEEDGEEEESDEEGEEEDEDEEDESEEEEEEEESDEEEDEDDSEEEETDTDSAQIKQYITLDDFKAEEKGDLAFRKGEILTILEAQSDGWLVARNSKGKEGMVPMTFLQEHQTESAESEEEDEVTHAEGEEEEEEEEPTTPNTPKSARDLWKDIKSAVKEKSATDVLHALGAMPSGFRESTLAKLSKQEQYSMKAFLTPKLSNSGVSFRDLFLDDNTDLLRSRTVKVQKIITITQARQIPLPGTDKGDEGAEIQSRHARICLFDGQNILSNIHTMKVASVDKEQRAWTFNNKTVDLKRSIEFSEVFIRTNSSDTNIGVLVELCVTFKRTSTGKEGELSCGWAFFKLFDTDGKPTPPKTYEEPISGGTIYERGVELDANLGKKDSVSAQATTSRFRALVAGNKQPKLTIRLQDPTKEQKAFLDSMPDVLVSATLYISYLAFYRHLLADLVLRDRSDLQSTEPIYSPLVASFPGVVEQTDLMDVLRTCWAQELKATKRIDKVKHASGADKSREKPPIKDIAMLKEKFQRVYFINVYPLVMCASLPPWDFAHQTALKDRYDEIQRIWGMNQGSRTVAASLLSSQVDHKPLNLENLSFNIVNKHCMVKAHGV